LSDPTIRPETPADHDAVFAVNVSAFETDAEGRLVEALRPLADPLVSLVAVLDDELVGHILFTPVTVEHASPETSVLGLGPMAVVSGRQRTGIGTKLARAGIAACRELGADALVVLGHADYYPRFGFRPARPAGLWYGSAELDPHFMVLELREGALATLGGEARYLPAFDEV